MTSENLKIVMQLSVANNDLPVAADNATHCAVILLSFRKSLIIVNIL